MKPIYLKKTEVAGLFNVSKTAISKMTKPDGVLYPALVDGRVDISHECVKAYAKKRGTKLPESLTKTEPKEGAKYTRTGITNRGTRPSFIMPAELEEQSKKGIGGRPKKEIENNGIVIEVGDAEEDTMDYGSMTLNEVAEQFGTMAEFSEHLKAVKIIAEIETKRVANLQKEGELISKEVVRQYIFGPMEERDTRLVTDAPSTIAAKLKDIFATGGDTHKAEVEVEKIISQILKAAKNKIQRSLKENIDMRPVDGSIV